MTAPPALVRNLLLPDAHSGRVMVGHEFKVSAPTNGRVGSPVAGPVPGRRCAAADEQQADPCPSPSPRGSRTGSGEARAFTLHVRLPALGRYICSRCGWWFRWRWQLVIHQTQEHRP